MLTTPEPKQGGPALPLSASWMAQLHRFVRALSNIEVKRGGGDSVQYGDGNVVITLKRIEDYVGAVSTITVKEQDSSPSVTTVTEIRFPNGSLTDEGGGAVSVIFPFTVKEQDSSPSVTTVTEMRFPNGSLTDEGGGAVSVKFPFTVKEQDSSPSVTTVTEMRFPNGSLTDEGGGAVSVAFTTGTTLKWGVLQANHTTSNDYVSVKEASYNAGTNAWDVTGSAFNAALPVLQRNASKPSSSHGDAVAVLWPAYASGDVVLMAQVTGGTGVEVGGVDLEWVIVPNERSWCFEFPICTTASTYYAIVPAWSMAGSSNSNFNPVD